MCIFCAGIAAIPMVYLKQCAALKASCDLTPSLAKALRMLIMSTLECKRAFGISIQETEELDAHGNDEEPSSYTSIFQKRVDNFAEN